MGWAGCIMGVYCVQGLLASAHIYFVCVCVCVCVCVGGPQFVEITIISSQQTSFAWTANNCDDRAGRRGTEIEQQREREREREQQKL